MTYRMIFLSAVILLLFITGSPSRERRDGYGHADLLRGREIYEEWCSQCHGRQGKGDGTAASHMYPKPRDFTGGAFKFRTTPSGELPTDQDLLRTITRGVSGTAMPGFDNLSPRDRWNVIAHIKTFSERFREETAPKGLAIGKPPRMTIARISSGRDVYVKKGQCVVCHGSRGRGDGPSSPTLKDDWGERIYPTDFTDSGNFRGGSSVADIYRALSTGLNGTPMPSYLDGLTDEERWDAAIYVKSLAQDRDLTEPVLVSGLLTGDLPLDPNDGLWQKAPISAFALAGQVVVEPRWYSPSVNKVHVRSFHNRRSIAFRVSWQDRTRDVKHSSDRIVLQFPLSLPKGEEKPYFLLGSASTPVQLWSWDLGDEIPKPFVSRGQRKTGKLAGYFSLTGKAVHRDGQWSAVFIYTSHSRDGAWFFSGEGRYIPVAFRVSDGSWGENEKQCSISSWHYLYLQGPPSPLFHLIPIFAVIATVLAEIVAARWIRRFHV